MTQALNRTKRPLLIPVVVAAVLVVAGSGFLAARASSSGGGEARRVEPAHSATIVGSAGERLKIGVAVAKIPDSQRPITGEPLKVSDLLLVAGINVPTEPQGRSLVLAAISSSEWTLVDADTGDELGVVPASRDVVAIAVFVESSHQRFEIVSGDQRSGPLQVSIACTSVGFAESTSRVGSGGARYAEADVRSVPPLETSC